jgi:hypothetical protein
MDETAVMRDRPSTAAVYAERVDECTERFDSLAAELWSTIAAFQAAPPSEQVRLLNTLALETGTLLGLLEGLAILGADGLDESRRRAEEIVDQIESVQRALERRPTA